MTNASAAPSTAADPGQPYYTTFSRPLHNGWGDDILPFKVADELHRRELLRPSLGTAPQDSYQARQRMSGIASQQIALRDAQSFLPQWSQRRIERLDLLLLLCKNGRAWSQLSQTRVSMLVW
jgi:hypothetical protein